MDRYVNLSKWAIITLVGLGGAMGALLRYAWGYLFMHSLSSFPWGVFTENVLGAFLLGCLMAVYTGKKKSHRYIRAFFGIGLIGSFTTFSAITKDIFVLFESGGQGLLAFYIIATIFGGILAAFSGILIGRFFLKNTMKNRPKL